ASVSAEFYNPYTGTRNGAFFLQKSER
ncbi:hypothetical protein, partial [Escherichia coli]